MNTSLSWIKVYVPDLDVAPNEYVDAMTLSGTKVEGYEDRGKDLEGIFVGQIKSIEKHPDADKLVVCQVDIGQEELVQIVTGARNIQVSDKIPVVLDGGRVACDHDGNLVSGGVKIKKGKLRGIISNGMMCSIQELGSTCELYPEADADGIYILDQGAIVGENAVKLLGLDDINFEYEVTSNRVDCFSVIGIAREVAATFGKKLILPLIKETGNQEDVNTFIQVQVEDTTKCTRYVARVIKNVKIEASPIWMQRYLSSIGIRPINNIVDITNFVMEEMGQPMHSYDLSFVEQNKIIVKTAKDGDLFTTLDGQERNVDSSTLMICDGVKAIGIAGIMGGQNSMITSDATRILLESACFDGTNIRLSSKKVGLRTEASGKFEKGLDPNTAMEAMNRACCLIEELGAGEVVGGCVDSYPNPVYGNRVLFQPEEMNQLLGISISEKLMLNYLENVDLQYDPSTRELIIPSWRQDIHEMNDVAEEVARFYGYDQIPTSLPRGETTPGKISKMRQLQIIAGQAAKSNGFSQAMNYSFESPKVFDKLLISAESCLRKAVVIQNPLGEDFSIMRTTSLNGMMTNLSTNYNRRNKNVRLFEFGNVYLPKELPINQLPTEIMELTLGMYGEGDFFDLKGVVEHILLECGIKEMPEYSSKHEHSFLHPGKSAVMNYGEIELGFMGEIHPSVVRHYELKGAVYIAVLHLPVMLNKSSFHYKYKGVAKYPAVNRDLSLLVPKEINAAQLEKIIKKAAGSHLEKVELFDLYEGDQVTDEYKSMAYSLVFRAKDKTLEETDISNIMAKIKKMLSEQGIELRQ